MKRKIAIWTICFVALIVWTGSASAQAFESMACRSATITNFQNSKELVIMNFELKGILQSKTNSEILNNVSEMCVGTFKKVGDEITQRGFCKYMYPNGDINVVEWDGGANDGKWQFLLGTGKWENIKGGGNWKVFLRAKPIVEGTAQSCMTITGTYELKK
jgi:hypothetical protein